MILEVLGSKIRLSEGDAGRAFDAEPWSRCVRPDGPHDGEVNLHGDARSAEIGITRRGIELARGRLHVWHAAGVSLPSGQVVALVGPSGSGKTTAAGLLASSGWGYVTDEALGIRLDGTVVPYPKPLAVVGSTGKTLVGPDELGLGRHPRELTLAAIVLLDRRHDETRPSLTRVSVLEGALGLIAQSSGLVSPPYPLRSTLRLISRCGGIHRLAYRDISSALELLRDLVRDDAFPPRDNPESWVPIECSENGHPAALAIGQVARAPFADAVATDEEVLVLRDSVPVLMAGIGASIWRAATTPMPIREVLDHLRRTHGDHPLASDLAGAAIDQLAGAGVLLRGQAVSRDEPS